MSSLRDDYSRGERLSADEISRLARVASRSHTGGIDSESGTGSVTPRSYDEIEIFQTLTEPSYDANWQEWKCTGKLVATYTTSSISGSYGVHDAIIETLWLPQFHHIPPTGPAPQLPVGRRVYVAAPYGYRWIVAADNGVDTDTNDITWILRALVNETAGVDPVVNEEFLTDNHVLMQPRGRAITDAPAGYATARNTFGVTLSNDQDIILIYNQTAAKWDAIPGWVVRFAVAYADTYALADDEREVTGDLCDPNGDNAGTLHDVSFWTLKRQFAVVSIKAGDVLAIAKIKNDWYIISNVYSSVRWGKVQNDFGCTTVNNDPGDTISVKECTPDGTVLDAEAAPVDVTTAAGSHRKFLLSIDDVVAFTENKTGKYMLSDVYQEQVVETGADCFGACNFGLNLLPGYDVAKKQALIHDNGCLQWMDIDAC